MVEQLATDAADPALGDAVLPGTAGGRPRGCDAERPKRRDDSQAEDRVTVEDQMAWPEVERERLSQLLDDPRRGRVICHFDVQDAAPSVINREPGVDDTERGRRDEE